MNVRIARAALVVHTVVTAVAGVTFFLSPGSAAALWPWPLPPLAARFMGALFLGGAVCSAVCLRAAAGRGVRVLAWLAVGDGLIALTALIGPAPIEPAPGTAGFVAFFAALAGLLAIGATAGSRAASPWPVPDALLRVIRGFFVLHLLVVLPVGAAMYLAPDWAQPHWPWKMAPINVRLIGSFFFGAAFISAWALYQSGVPTLRAILALYTTFATAATVAALIHVGLFDPARRTTWAFFALYVFVAAGSAWLLRLLGQAPRAAPA